MKEAGDRDLVSALRGVFGSEIRLVVYGNVDTAEFADDRVEIRPRARCDEDLAEGDAVRVLELAGLSLKNGDARDCLSRFVGNLVWVDAADIGDAGAAEFLLELGFAPVPDCPNLFALDDLLLAAERWLERGRRASACRALSGVSAEESDWDRLLRAQTVARACEATELEEALLIKLAGIDRGYHPAYGRLAELAEARGDAAQALRYSHEGARTGSSEPGLDEGGRPSALRASSRILVVTNLFPPQEMGGYGRKMWEFAFELRRRGHIVRVLSGDCPSLAQRPTEAEGEMDRSVSRCLSLFGDWSSGSAERRVSLERAAAMAAENERTVADEIASFRPDYCLAGNLDFIGHGLLEALRRAKVPTVQCLGNATPGWPVDYAPSPELYRAGPASDHLGRKMRRNGYALSNARTLYPGARLDIFYREVLPANELPKIVFAGILMPYKGPQTLIEALAMLASAGVDFRATFAGPEPSAETASSLRKAAEQGGIGDKLSWVGFQDRAGLNRVFMRHNILVFPSIVEEAFGISQVEAMASGLAVVTSATGGAAEIVRDEVDGLVFAAGDARSLATRLATLMADPAKWRRLQANGRDRAKEFAIPATVDRIEALFLEMDRSKTSE